MKNLNLRRVQSDALRSVQLDEDCIVNWIEITLALTQHEVGKNLERKKATL